MIAWTGVLAWTHGVATPFRSSSVKPRWRLEEVEIPWLR
jgi:N6-L-threonylcarbamoyladenine synthase